MHHLDPTPGHSTPRHASAKSISAAVLETLRPHAGHEFTAAGIHVQVGSESASRALGHLGDDRPELATPQTMFDVASITKIATMSSVLSLIAKRKFSLDSTVHYLLPEFSSRDADRITVRHLLSHTSGLPASIGSLASAGPDADSRWAAFHQDPWGVVLAGQCVAEPGTRVIYSDIGYLLLGRIIEKVTGQNLATALLKLLPGPNPHHGIQFGSGSNSPCTHDPMEVLPTHDLVHDPKSRFLGGVTGAAGMFATPEAIGNLARSFLRPAYGLHCKLINEAVTERASTNGVRFGLGWELRTTLPHWPEEPFDPSSFGSQGHTGSIVWADPTRDLVVVILTNGIHHGNSVSHDGALTKVLSEATCRAVTLYDQSLSAGRSDGLSA